MSKTYRLCKVCGCVLVPEIKLNRRSTICYKCLQHEPYDLKIDVGNFHAELHTDAINSKNLCKLLDNVKHLSEEISKRSRT